MLTFRIRLFSEDEDSGERTEQPVRGLLSVRKDAVLCYWSDCDGDVTLVVSGDRFSLCETFDQVQELFA